MKISKYNVVVLLLMQLSFSCEKIDSSGRAQQGLGGIVVTVLGTEYAPVSDKDPRAQKASVSTGLSAGLVADTQRFEVNFHGEWQVVATVCEDISVESNTFSAGGAPRASTAKASNRKPLAGGITYVLAIYREDGSFQSQHRRIVGEPVEPIYLPAGRYHFISYSLNNSASDLPLLDETKSLSEVELTDINGDFMFFKATKEISPEQDHELAVVFKHQFSEINTIIDASVAGRITELSGVEIGLHYRDVGVTGLEDNTLSFIYGDETQMKQVNFPAIGSGAYRLVGDSVLIAAPSSSQGQIRIGRISVGGMAKNNLTIGGVKIQPGKKYKVTLEITDGNIAIGDLVWAKGNVVYSGGRWSFAAHQYEYGSYFGQSHLLPVTVRQLQGGDPCEKVGEGWRRPRESDFDRLQRNGNASGAKQFVANTVYPGTNVRGIWYPRVGEGVFLPYAGLRQWGNVDNNRPKDVGTRGYYWAQMEGQGYIALTAYRPAYSNVVVYPPTGENIPGYGTPVRCVRDRP